jgi:motility quorum-sensing regulator/GCU-specific mRNA interferase toxin
MEKRNPHYALDNVKALIKTGKVRVTASAINGAALLGLDRQDILNVIVALTTKDFYKSMTTYSDHTIWQDVYRPNTSVGNVYLKLTIIDELLIISFKEL